MAVGKSLELQRFEMAGLRPICMSIRAVAWSIPISLSIGNHSPWFTSALAAIRCLPADTMPSTTRRRSIHG